ncbi:MAG: hypothetical protein FWB99_01295 [Treponema sp.]|nr:hypothetical protein [Treponema sp.]
MKRAVKLAGIIAVVIGLSFASCGGSGGGDGDDGLTAPSLARPGIATLPSYGDMFANTAGLQPVRTQAEMGDLFSEIGPIIYSVITNVRSRITSYLAWYSYSGGAYSPNVTANISLASIESILAGLGLSNISGNVFGSSTGRSVTVEGISANSRNAHTTNTIDFVYRSSEVSSPHNFAEGDLVARVREEFFYRGRLTSRGWEYETGMAISLVKAFRTERFYGKAITTMSDVYARISSDAGPRVYTTPRRTAVVVYIYNMQNVQQHRWAFNQMPF